MSPTERQVPHALLTRSPLSRKPKLSAPFDLHVLGTPPAFVLSQDQTLKKLYLKALALKSHFLNKFVLANFTQEFSLAVFLRLIHVFLNNPFHCPRCLCSSLRYSIYKVQVADRSAVSLLILAHLFEPVKSFFQVFSRFFQCFSSSSRPSRQLAYISIP